ncbi:hypothetical protein [Yoonia litorea]|uniref:Primase C terminal 1 (PriCT-1) n=1 Tax=Yoonia litorea TaxID=1123755 RepID=A0A1I6MDV0_9RHOB|nr:hypothetical protein [Yoonia litorea]SFS13768.1 hypothetical protein SAMN05444714_1602 [Yoonia litorea]
MTHPSYVPEGLPNQFLNWRLKDGKKLPCRPDGTICDAHDTANHVDYATASAAPYDVAFALRAEDPWFFLDLDKCHEGTDWSQEAKNIVGYFPGAWIEVSQSGTGLHIMGRCDPSQLQDRRNKWDGWLEFYTQDRFIAFGPHGWSPIGGTATNKDWTRELLSFVPQREFLGELLDGRDPAYTGPENDDELIAMMLRSSSKASAFGDAATVKNLWEANVAVLAKQYPAYEESQDFDHSSADAALMSHLAF